MSELGVSSSITMQSSKSLAVEQFSSDAWLPKDSQPEGIKTIAISGDIPKSRHLPPIFMRRIARLYQIQYFHMFCTNAHHWIAAGESKESRPMSSVPIYFGRYPSEFTITPFTRIFLRYVTLCFSEQLLDYRHFIVVNQQKIFPHPPKSAAPHFTNAPGSFAKICYPVIPFSHVANRSASTYSSQLQNIASPSPMVSDSQRVIATAELLSSECEFSECNRDIQQNCVMNINIAHV